MVNISILQGLKLSVSKGTSLDKAMMSFLNAGYEKAEIEEAARELQGGNFQNQYANQQPVTNQFSGQQAGGNQFPIPPPTTNQQPMTNQFSNQQQSANKFPTQPVPMGQGASSGQQNQQNPATPKTSIFAGATKLGGAKSTSISGRASSIPSQTFNLQPVGQIQVKPVEQTPMKPMQQMQEKPVEQTQAQFQNIPGLKKPEAEFFPMTANPQMQQPIQQPVIPQQNFSQMQFPTEPQFPNPLDATQPNNLMPLNENQNQNKSLPKETQRVSDYSGKSSKKRKIKYTIFALSGLIVFLLIFLILLIVFQDSIIGFFNKSLV